MACYDTYRDQLASLYHGHALWVPDPSGLYDQVQVGDVGYVREGHFLRMFNVLLEANDLTQVYGVPEGFVPLDVGPFTNIRTLNLFQGDYCSSTVAVDHRDRYQAAGPDEAMRASFTCSRRCKGAFLSLPFNGVRKDAIRTKAFEVYIRKHCDSWLEFAIANDHDVRLEDIILVTGCDLTSSWAMAAFVNSLNPEISLSVQVSGAEIARFLWTATNQPHHNEPNQNVVKSHCVFLRGYRAKRILPFYKTLKAAAEPLPDDPDNEPGSSFELFREPTIPNYRDPLIGILDYIAEQRPNQSLAIAHEDGLKMIRGVDVLTADSVENFLRQTNFPVRTEKGVALLASEDEEGIHEEKMTFYAQANVGDEPLSLIIHSVLVEYLLKFDITSQSLDHDFGLPTEAFLSSAVHPPVHKLILENEQGLPQNIEVQASDEGSGMGVTVKDVLTTIGADLRKSSSQRELAALDEDTRREVEDAFKDRIRTEERVSDLRRIDYLRGRNRLQVFPKHPFPEDDDEIPQPLGVDVDGEIQGTNIAPPPSVWGSLFGSIFSHCFSFFHRIFHPNGRIRLPDSDHSFIPPSASDSRSPCPALNALANHSYLPHDGRGITAYQLMSAMRQHYHVSLPLATLLSVVGTFICGRHFTIDLEDLALHNHIEHDASLTRANAHPDGRYAPVSVDKKLLQNLLDASTSSDYLTFEDLVRVRAARDQTLQSPLSKFHGAISRGVVALTVQTLSDGEGRIPKQFIREWFGDDRIPEGWSMPLTTVDLLSTTKIANRVADLVKEVPPTKR